jgi:hypothetical protein
MLFTAPPISPSYYALRLFLLTYLTIEKALSLLCSACLSHAKFSLPDHHDSSSSSLVVILNLFIISGCYPKIPWLLWQSQLFVFSVNYSQSFWLLWLLSPFLHVTISGDYTPNQQVLRDL